MRDLVLEGFVNSFAEARGLSSLPFDELFEVFSTSSMLRKYHHTDIVAMENDVLVSGGGDGGIDAVAILVNGRLVSTEEGLQFFFDSHGRLDLEFVFIQAKSSAAFSASEIGNFAFGVEQYFVQVLNESSNIAFNSEIRQRIDLTRTIYSQAIKMQDNPRCFLYYVTTGKWTGAPEPKARFTDGKHRLSKMNLFSDVITRPVDAASLKNSYRELERSVIKDVEFIRTAAFPHIDRVGEAYIGLLPGSEFIKLISTPDGNLNRELFFDNVRDFQGHNSVNREIEHTLSSEQLRNSFPLLNNGITIIARSIKRTGDTFQIHDFQIVNGCQTAHILFNNRSVVGADTFIPVKLVATDDSQVVNEVIKATNRQTEVLPEALESLSAFHRELEDLYLTQESARPSTERIYYERRSKQYSMDNIKANNIVTLTGQITSFIGMFLNEPHSHPRYYGELLKAYQGRIFAGDHKPEPYYASGVSLLIVEKWLGSRQEWRNIRPYKYQLLMLLRMSIGGFGIPKMNSGQIAPYSLRVVDALRGPEGEEAFEIAISALRESLTEFRESRGGRLSEAQRNPPHRLRAFTEQILKDMYATPSAKQKIVPAARDLTVGIMDRGIIRFFDDVRRYGFIGSSRGSDIFVHESEISAIPYHLRVGGVEVDYKVANNPKSPGMLMASDVKLVPIEEVKKR